MQASNNQNNIIKVNTEGTQRVGVAAARDILTSGGIVAFPTESFYGLAVNAMDENAIKNLFTIKKRDPDQPILILIPSLRSLEQYVTDIPDMAQELIDNFWPGGLTLIFNASKAIPALLTSGSHKIGIRLSSHPIATNLAQSINGPISGTSANLSGQPPSTNAPQVFESLGDKVDLILDNGTTPGGKGSTILDTTTSPFRILRDGMVGRDELERYIS